MANNIQNRSTYEVPVINDYKAHISDLGFFGDIRFDPDDSAPDYVGLHPEQGAATDGSDPVNWKLYAFTYSGGAVTRIRLGYGAWDDRATILP